MNIETLLHVEIADEFEALSKMEKGSEEHRATVDELTKLMDRAIEMEKINIENQNREESRKDEQKERLIRNSITVAGIVLPSLITIWGTVKSFEFEKEGAITTIMGRGFINKLLPKK